jgi:hypothetical protein
MGRMKELYMKIHYPQGDLEREYLINDSYAKEQEYEEYLKLMQDPEIQLDQTKIEVNGTTRIEIHKTDKTTMEESEIKSLDSY